MAKRTIPYAQALAIKAFLTYLNKHYSKLVNPSDNLLVAAVAAWWMQEGTGSIGNNPFNIRPGMVSFMASGVRTSKNGNGKFLVFASLAKGFEAAAYLLMHANKAYGYQLAISALKHSGNQAANDFLAAMAMSSWDAAHYGAHSWQEAYDAKTNHLLRNYLAIGGVQMSNPHPKPPKPKPQLPRDFNYSAVVRNYLDPWAVKALYNKRHGRSTVDSISTKR